MLNELKILFISLLFILLSKNCAFSDNNFVDVDFGLDNVKNIKKIWTYNSGIFKDSQTKPILHNDKIIFLDGHFILRSLSFHKIPISDFESLYFEHL